MCLKRVKREYKKPLWRTGYKVLSKKLLGYRFPFYDIRIFVQLGKHLVDCRDDNLSCNATWNSVTHRWSGGIKEYKTGYHVFADLNDAKAWAGSWATVKVKCLVHTSGEQDFLENTGKLRNMNIYVCSEMKLLEEV